MKALVTGASGFTGSHLVRALEQQGHAVVGFVRKSSNLARLAECNVHLVYGDITDHNALKVAMTGVDTVFHTAAYVELGLVNEAEMQRVNVAGTRAVLEVAQAGAVRKPPALPKVVYCSTIGVLGHTGSQVVDETFQRTQTDFSSAYDRTKYAAQQLVDQFAAQGLPVISLLPSGIMGPNDPHFGPVIRQFLKRRLKVWAGGDRITGIVHVDDLVTALILAAERGKPEHYIISAGDLTTREMFDLLSHKTGIPSPREVPEPLVRLVGSLLDPLGHLFSWQPPLSRERVHYLYDRCVRVDATKACQELNWSPRSVPATLEAIVSDMI